MATAGDAGHLVAGELVPDRGMHRVALKRASARVAMQAFAIVVGLIELDVFRPWRRAEVLDVNVAQSSELGAKSAVEAVVGVTGVARFVGRNAMVLEMGGRNVGRIIHIEAFTVRLHDMAGKAEFRLLGTFDVSRGCHGSAKNRQHAEGNEGEHFAGWRECYRRTDDDNGDENRRNHQQRVQQGFRGWQIQCNVLAELPTTPSLSTARFPKDRTLENLVISFYRFPEYSQQAL